MNAPIYNELKAVYGTWTHHTLRYDSFLMMIDGELVDRCFGCGEWKTADHPVPPLCVFSISDFI